jgi:hypothetical protein
MAKNFKSIYDNTGDSISLEQQYFVKEEITAGTLIGPTDTDFLFTLPGTVDFSQSNDPSEHRSGRHNNDTIKGKKVVDWEIPTYINIDIGVAAGITELDLAMRLLWEVTLGRELIPGGVTFDAVTTPNKTMSIFENGDKVATQVNAAFVETAVIAVPGDGTPGFTFGGGASDRKRVGIGSFTTDAGVHTPGTPEVILDNPSEAKRFPVGSLVMIIEADGATRSADTLNGTYRSVVSRDTGTGSVIISGADLLDADGSATTAFFIAYAEPETPTSINGIQSGLEGSFSIDGLGGLQSCIRSMTINIDNQVERVDYCALTDSLSAPYVVYGDRLMVTVDMELNLNDNSLEWLDDKDAFIADDIDVIIGDSATRHFRIDLPKVEFAPPSTPIPDSGSVPFTAAGLALQTASGAGDEILLSYL